MYACQVARAFLLDGYLWRVTGRTLPAGEATDPAPNVRERAVTAGSSRPFRGRDLPESDMGQGL